MIFSNMNSLCVRWFSAAVANTCYTLHNGKSYFARRCDKFRIHHNGIDLYLHHRRDCKLDKCTVWRKWIVETDIIIGESRKMHLRASEMYFFLVTLPNLTPQFSHSACTFCRVSHFVQINSVKVFLSKW